jgi:hypothetical protein
VSDWKGSVEENSSVFIGLENYAASQKFKDLVISAVQNAKTKKTGSRYGSLFS